ncbi:MAG TPA: SDR family oxidoreductase [Pseudonocardiaceae bacterium]|jgi:nucleoside-diphosphate-sugar epimerase|nr:SDR family oxidoreductase [Pseudonocardiaceae bacterium]
MRVFVTGASGWIGFATVEELLGAGHQVIGLARSDRSAASLEAKGATVLRGDLDDLDSLRRGALESEAVVHLANKHDWNNPAESTRAERAAVETIVEALVGSDHPLVIASGVAGLAKGRPAIETDPSPAVGPDSPRGGTENLALEYVDRGVRTISARFAPTVHGIGDHGFISYIAAAARRHGVSGYVGDGSSAWSAVHRSDAARLVRLGLEKAPAGSILHAVGEEAVSTRAIAEAIGRALDLPVASVAPEDAVEHFGFIGGFFAMDLPASSARTRELLGWAPTGPSLIADIEAGGYPGA